MLIPREGSLLLAASGSLRIVCEPIAINLAWNLIFGIKHQTIARLMKSNIHARQIFHPGKRLPATENHPTRKSLKTQDEIPWLAVRDDFGNELIREA